MKHIEIDIHFACEKIILGHVGVLHVPPAHQFADMMARDYLYNYLLTLDSMCATVTLQLQLWVNSMNYV